MSGPIDQNSDLKKRIEELEKKVQLLQTTFNELIGEDNGQLPATSVLPHPGPAPNAVMPLIAAHIADSIQLSERLIQAAEYGFPNEVLKCLAEGADVTYQDPRFYRTALQEAAWNGRLAVVIILVKAGAPPDMCENGKTPLHYAAFRNHWECLLVLIGAGADINKQDRNGSTPLHTAATNNYIDSMRVLLEAGADASIKNKHNETARQIAEQICDESDICSLFARHS